MDSTLYELKHSFGSHEKLPNNHLTKCNSLRLAMTILSIKEFNLFLQLIIPAYSVNEIFHQTLKTTSPLYQSHSFHFRVGIQTPRQKPAQPPINPQPPRAAASPTSITNKAQLNPNNKQQ